MRAKRFGTNPLIDIDGNVNGPSVVRAPDGGDLPGEYYCYFAAHDGEATRVATAYDPEGPWTVRGPALALADTGFDDHIASPDVHVDDDRMRMYFHGCCGEYEAETETVSQWTELAVSADGVSFDARDEPLGRFYFRVFEYGGDHYALAKENRGPEQRESGFAVYRSGDGLSGFEKGPTIRNDGARHAAVRVRGDTLDLLYSRIGDAPERILHTTVDLAEPWREWHAPAPETVVEPGHGYEGADRPVEPSELGGIHEPVCQLRDPAILEDGEETYLFYAAAGEQSIAGARLTTR
jgi:hypothetical protein